MPTPANNRSIPLNTVAVAAVLLSAAYPNAREIGKRDCKPSFEKVSYSRSLPHAYFDQAMESLPELYPEHEMLASRRFSRLGKVTYSLVAYRAKPSDSLVQIGGAAERYPDAWRFSGACPEDSLPEILITTLEMISNL